MSMTRILLLIIVYCNVAVNSRTYPDRLTLQDFDGDVQAFKEYLVDWIRSVHKQQREEMEKAKSSSQSSGEEEKKVDEESSAEQSSNSDDDNNADDQSATSEPEPTTQAVNEQRSVFENPNDPFDGGDGIRTINSERMAAARKLESSKLENTQKTEESSAKEETKAKSAEKPKPASEEKKNEEKEKSKEKSESSSSATADEAFQACCQDNLPEPCWEYCYYKKFTTNHLVKMYTQQKCPRDKVQDFFECSTQNLDHSQCCTSNGFKGKCMELCMPNPVLGQQHISCMSKIAVYKKCFKSDVQEALDDGDLVIH